MNKRELTSRPFVTGALSNPCVFDREADPFDPNRANRYRAACLIGESLTVLLLFYCLMVV
jgi:hypothetical protein